MGFKKSSVWTKTSAEVARGSEIRTQANKHEHLKNKVACQTHDLA